MTRSTESSLSLITFIWFERIDHSFVSALVVLVNSGFWRMLIAKLVVKRQRWRAIER